MKHDQGQSCIQIRDIGSFFVGGRIATLTGQPQRRVRVARNGPDRMVDCKILEDLTKIPGTLDQDSWNTWPRFLEHLAKVPGTLGQGSWRT